MRYNFIIVLLVCIVLGVSGQDNAGGPPDKKASAALAEYERLIKYYRYYNQDSAIYYANKAIELARENCDKNGEALILIQIGMIDDNVGEFDKSIKNYRQALELFSEIDSTSGIASATIRIGVVELRNGKYDEAIRYFFDALKVAEGSGNAFGIMEANYSISWAYLDQDKNESALQYLTLAEQQHDALPFSPLLLNIYNHFGRVYRNLRQFGKARYYLEKGISLSNQPEYQGLNITLINNLASVYSEEGFKEKAIALQKDALTRSRALGNYLRELQTLYGLARTYESTQPSEAIFYLNQAIDLARSKKAYKQEMRYLKHITKLYKSHGNYREAFITKEREYQLADSFLNNTMTQNISALKAEYELSKSNARINELNLLDKQRQLQLDNAALTKNVTLAGLVLLSLILGLLFNQYRIKRRNSIETNKKNQSLQRLLNEKEWLLKEIHHRVKNNLQTVVSLLESQSAYLHDDALLAIQDSQNRVYAMSLIHQKLYQTDSVAAINMVTYLQDLVNYLRDSFDVKQWIKFHLEIDPIELDVSQSVPVGLILNESITNSIKYAFPFRRSDNTITIRMTQSESRQIVLFIADNGLGLPPAFDSVKNGNLGLRLMKGLTEDLGGEFIIHGEKGTVIVINFSANALLRDTCKSMDSELVLLRA
jgi:two-component sensor histidine kinase/tetratricopeptide (TPR) repeat protein